MKRYRPILPLVLAGAACLAGTAAQAQMHVPVYTGTPLMIATGVVTQQTLNRQIDAAHSPGGSSGRATSGGGHGAAAPRGADLSVSGTPAGMPAKLAAHAPAAARADTQRLYEEILQRYPALMRQLGVPAQDLAAALATFLAGSYVAYRGVDFPDSHFKPLVQQMRGVLDTQPALARAGAVQRRELYEQFAILGTYMALTTSALKQRPDAQQQARLRDAARNYLQQFMQLDPERLRLSDQGLSVQ
ncbi:DUF6683 family protein [Azohydromonas aeria]|uniref:DUF6683 family protein n=1 Tax=Azohydromonas aeria TaxID=2590212 RepID=UPI0012F89500|nr:DUF6683 family protein [Azohydromonas aeria]